MKTDFIGRFGLFAILAAVAVVTYIFGAVGLILGGSVVAAGLTSGSQPDGLRTISTPIGRTTRTTCPNELGERLNQGERFARTTLAERLDRPNYFR